MYIFHDSSSNICEYTCMCPPQIFIQMVTHKWQHVDKLISWTLHSVFMNVWMDSASTIYKYYKYYYTIVLVLFMTI